MSLQISEEKMNVLRSIVRDHMNDYMRDIRDQHRREKSTKTRKRWRDLVHKVIENKRSKKQRLQRMDRVMVERRRALQAAVHRTRVKAVQEQRRCVICLHYYSTSDLVIQRLMNEKNLHQHLGLPKRHMNTTVSMWCCRARVHIACVLQTMYSVYGRENKHFWRCVHCRRYMMDSREDDCFKISLREVDPFDSSDDEEIEHYHRITSRPPEARREGERWIRDESNQLEFQLDIERDEDR